MNLKNLSSYFEHIKPYNYENGISNKVPIITDVSFESEEINSLF